jgi:cell division protein FtsB
MPRQKRTAGLSFKTKLLVASVSFLFLVLVIASFFGDRGLIAIYRVSQNVESLETQVERLTRERDELLREIQELRDNPEAIRERARELGLGLPDETIILK